MNVSSGRWWALSAMVLSTVVVGLDTTVLSLALPDVGADLHASTGALQWIVDSYNLVLAAVVLPAGLLGDRFGRKRLLAIALAAFGVASLICAYAGSSGQLITGRVLLGLAAAFLMTLPAAVLPQIFPPEERPRAMTIWVTANVLGFPIGPIVGGLLLNSFWWGSVFLINVPIVILALVAVVVLLPESRTPLRVNLDLPGVLLSSAALVTLTYAVIEAGEGSWTDAGVLVAVVLTVVLAVGFGVWQRRVTAGLREGEHPLIDLGVFRIPGFSWGTAIGVTVSFAMFGLLFATPLYMRSVLGYDALHSGLGLLPLVAAMLAGTRVVGPVTARLGVRAAAVLGFVFLTAGMLIGASTSMRSGYGLLGLWLAVFGFGLGFTLPTGMNAALGAVPPDRAGLGSGLLMALRMVGGSIGVAVLGAVLNAAYRARLDERILGALPDSVAGTVRDGAATGVPIAQASGSPAFLDGVRAAFLHGMAVMFLVCAGVTLLGAVVAMVSGPGRLGRPAPPIEASSSDDAVAV